MASRTCKGFTQTGNKCRNPVAAGREVCGRCKGIVASSAGDQSPAIQASKAFLIRLRDEQISDDERVAVSGTTGDDLTDEPTRNLVGSLRTNLDDAIGAYARAEQLGGGSGSVAALDQAHAARRDASRHEDAIRLKHPDPYGAALITGAREAAAGEDNGEATVIRRWLANSWDDATQDHVHMALNRIAEIEVGRERLQKMPWVNDLNRVASYRAMNERRPGADDEGLLAAEAAWAMAAPPAAAR